MIKLRTFLILNLILGLLCSSVYAETIISSNITTDTTWTKKNSPYIIVNNIDVYPDVTLTLEPGVEVHFPKEYDGWRYPGDLDIYGELIAIGTQNDLIVFTGVGGVYVGLIEFKKGAVGATYDINGNYSKGSVLKYCSITNTHGIASEVNLCVLNSELSNNYGLIILKC